MSGTSYSMVWPGVMPRGLALHRIDVGHALDEGVGVALVHAAQAVQRAHDADGLHQRFRIVEDRFVVQAGELALRIAVGV